MVLKCLRVLLASAFALTGVLLLTQTLSGRTTAALSTVAWRAPRPAIDACLSQGNGTPQCSGCLRNECRTNTAAAAFERCTVSCATTGPATIKGFSCADQGNGTAACRGCLQNECRRSVSAVALENCRVSCTAPVTRVKGDPCRNQGNGSPACSGCLENECRMNAAAAALEICSKSCAGTPPATQPAQQGKAASSSGKISCTQQGNGTGRCGDCLERRCRNFRASQALTFCAFYCR